MNKVSPYWLEKLNEWTKAHPIYEITIPEGTQWGKLKFKNTTIYFPYMISILHRQFMLLSKFPFSDNQQFLMGGQGIVGAYESMGEETKSSIILKISILSEKSSQSAQLEHEKHAYDILRFMIDQDLFGESTCGSNFINITAASVIPYQNLNLSLIALETMDTNLGQLFKTYPKIANYPQVIQAVFKSINDGLICLHLAKPVPLVHGDIKPANLLCSPYSLHWIDEFIQNNNQNNQTLQSNQIDESFQNTNQKLKEEIKEGPINTVQQSFSLLDNKLVYVKLGDYDEAFLNAWTPEVKNVYSAAYTSPEFYLTGKHRPSDDIWAMGLTMIVCCGIKNPFSSHYYVDTMMSLKGKKEEWQKFVTTWVVDTVEKVVKELYSNLLQKGWHFFIARSFVRIIRTCLEVNVSRRITVLDISDQPFVQGKLFNPSTLEEELQNYKQKLKQKSEALQTEKSIKLRQEDAEKAKITALSNELDGCLKNYALLEEKYQSEISKLNQQVLDFENDYNKLQSENTQLRKQIADLLASDSNEGVLLENLQITDEEDEIGDEFEDEEDGEN